MPTTDKLQYSVRKISNTYASKIRSETIITNITINKEEYLNILKKLLELPSMPDIGEPDMILADGKQWKSDVE